MSAKRFGISDNQIIPQPDFAVQISPEGKATATQTFAYLKGNWGDVSDKFPKGKLLKDLDSNSEPEFGDVLRLDSFGNRVQRGGYMYVSCNFVGQYEGEESTFGEGVRYARNATLVERPITEHPEFDAIEGLAEYLDGRGVIRPSSGSGVTIMDAVTQRIIAEITDTEEVAKFNMVVAGLRTWEDATSTWTMTRSTAGTLGAADLANMGKVDTPQGNPYTRPNANWILIGATEDLPQNEINTYSLTWEERFISHLPWAEIIYGYTPPPP